MDKPLRDFAVTFRDRNNVVAARGRSQARFEFARRISEALGVPVGGLIAHIKVRALGPVTDRTCEDSEAVDRCSVYRGLKLRRGQRVQTRHGAGCVIGAGGGALFEIALEKGGPALFFHPSELILGALAFEAAP